MDIFDVNFFTNTDSGHSGDSFTGIPDGAGGMDVFFDDGSMENVGTDGLNDMTLGMVVDNVMGGLDTIIDGVTDTTSIPNVHGGVDIYEGTELKEQMIPNIDGGLDVFDSDMSMEGTLTDNIFGGIDFISSVDDNFSDIMEFDNPLDHVSDIEMPKFDMDK